LLKGDELGEKSTSKTKESKVGNCWGKEDKKGKVKKKTEGTPHWRLRNQRQEARKTRVIAARGAMAQRKPKAPNNRGKYNTGKE